MIKNCFVCFKIIVLMLCSVVGVGFVSGAEIYQFFVRFKNFSYFGIFVFFVLIWFLTSKILKENACIQNGVKLNNLNKNISKNAFLIKFKLKSKLLFFNILMMASAMFAGLFNVINKLFFNNYFIICILAFVIIFVILFFGISGLQKFDYLVLILLGFIAVYFCCNLSFDNADVVYFNSNSSNVKDLFLSILFAVIYVFMNIVQIEPILIENKIKFSSGSRKIFSFIFALVLTLLLALFVKFFNSNLYLKNCEMPFIKFFESKGGVVYVLFVLGLFMALFSSLITSLLGVKNKLKQKLDSNFFACICAIVLTMAISLIGFKNFVSVVYPTIGIINFIIYVFL